MATAFAAVAAGGTHSAGQRVRIEAKGAGRTFAFVLSPRSQGRLRRDTGPLAFCCWETSSVTRAGAKLDVSNPRLTFAGKQGTLRIRDQIEFVPLPEGWSVFTGTWKVVGGSGTYAGVSGRGRVAGVWAADGNLRLRLFGFLQPK
ncbi:MAG TPA: hypothetical protein VFU30_00875 [Gaiellaceae bacterium]|nr:hypothetical protein [Gaiellaceae bacterium]